MQVQKQEQKGGREAADKEKVEWGEEFFPFSFLPGFLSRAAHHIMTNVAVRGYSTREEKRTIKTLPPPVRRRAAAAAARSFPFFNPFPSLSF